MPKSWVIKVKGGKFLSDWTVCNEFQYSTLQNAILFGDKSEVEYYCNEEISESLKPKPVRVNIEIIKAASQRK